MDYLKNLNHSQREAVLRTEGPVRVVAGPGTGKTRAIVARYCHLVDGQGIPPRNILCVTFTNKAADEMKRRVRALLGGDMDLGLVCTFHAFSRLMLKDEIHRMSYPPSFPVLDREDQKELLTKIFREMGLSARDLTYGRAIDTILETGKLTGDYIEKYMTGPLGPVPGPMPAPVPAAAGGSGAWGITGQDSFREGPAEGAPARTSHAESASARSGLTEGSADGAGQAAQGPAPAGPASAGSLPGAFAPGAEPDLLRSELAMQGLPRDKRIFLSYLREQRKIYALDFNDLINFAIHVLENHKNARERWQSRLQYVMVDEFQDVSRKQYRLAQILSAKHRNLFIVGDSDQTIYTWRGAHHKLFLDFPKRHPGTATFVLHENYRSTPQILSTADALITRNTVRFNKRLKPTLPAGGLPAFFNGKTEQEAAAWILEEISRLRDAGTPLGEAAVLCRSAYMTRPVEEAFFQAGLPFRLLCGTPFYSRREVKTAVCYLRMLAYADDVSFRRTVNYPSRGLGNKTLETVALDADRKGISLYEALKGCARSLPALWRKAGPDYIEVIDDLRERRARMDLGDLFHELLRRTGFEEHLRRLGDETRLENMAELKRVVTEFAADPESNLEDFLDKAALYTSMDAEGKKDAVPIMTIHASKGLEFDSVFVCGLNEGLFPSRRCEDWEQMEEERRLFYVAITRAKRLLRLAGADHAGRDPVLRQPSRFLLEIKDHVAGARPKDLELLKTQAESPAGFGRGEDPPPQRQSLPSFSKGDEVEHGSFGRGRILSVNLRGGSYSIKFEALSTARDIMFGASLRKPEA
ncbi:MAG: UvrD-helicase domain-containing protein [Deltaproteobacteria bacterium]|jgi:DNA helicase-2/ATP-dependent DNA helicase PcrA|nr:UvrD-helicase domain-containing protein [Deltaproteobacteria bacterium]